MAYMEWLKTQPAARYIPLYDKEGKVIGRFGGEKVGAAQVVSTSAGYPVCTLEGCTAEGYHTHGGVGYCGGAAHHGETCDGSCIYQAQQDVAGGHHQERHQGGHH